MSVRQLFNNTFSNEAQLKMRLSERLTGAGPETSGNANGPMTEKGNHAETLKDFVLR
jgi:hypothetical protein